MPQMEKKLESSDILYRSDTISYAVDPAAKNGSESLLHPPRPTDLILCALWPRLTAVSHFNEL